MIKQFFDMREKINNFANNQIVISKIAFQLMQSRHKITLNQRDMQTLKNIFRREKDLPRWLKYAEDK